MDYVTRVLEFIDHEKLLHFVDPGLAFSRAISSMRVEHVKIALQWFPDCDLDHSDLLRTFLWNFDGSRQNLNFFDKLVRMGLQADLECFKELRDNVGTNGSPRTSLFRIPDSSIILPMALTSPFPMDLSPLWEILKML